MRPCRLRACRNEPAARSILHVGIITLRLAVNARITAKYYQLSNIDEFAETLKFLNVSEAARIHPK
jgi:hypothetical protein